MSLPASYCLCHLLQRGFTKEIGSVTKVKFGIMNGCIRSVHNNQEMYWENSSRRSHGSRHNSRDVLLGMSPCSSQELVIPDPSCWGDLWRVVPEYSLSQLPSASIIYFGKFNVHATTFVSCITERIWELTRLISHANCSLILKSQYFQGECYRKECFICQ